MEVKNALQSKIIVSEVTEEDVQKIRRDLHFIDLINKFAKEEGVRLIVSGGYAVDSCLGKITRPHADIDMQIYGQDSNSSQLVEQLIEGIKEAEPSFSGLEIKDKERQEYYHTYSVGGNGFWSDIYYVQVTGNPYGKEKYVVKKDGSHTKRQEYGTLEVTLEGITFEAVDPTSELVDKLFKREIRGDKPKAKHDQDIPNLRLITDAEEVSIRLEEMKKSQE
jgi:hypothetical protein